MSDEVAKNLKISTGFVKISSVWGSALEIAKKVLNNL